MNVQILKTFIAARQRVTTQVMDETNEHLIHVQTFQQHDVDGRLLCEDVVVESRS